MAVPQVDREGKPLRARKPKVEYYWSIRGNFGADVSVAYAVVNWRLVGANGETMCQSTQGYRDKMDAQRAVDAVIAAFGFDSHLARVFGYWREVGPGRKPK